MQVKTDSESLIGYLMDASNMLGGHAASVFVPENAEEVSHILRDANEAGTPVTVSGARTGTVGGAVPFGGSVVSLEKFTSILIDRENRTATVGAGVILADLQKAVDAEGLFYPPDPTEWSCQIGGTVATNASGARSFKYGATRRYVRRLQVALADGEIVEIERSCGGPRVSKGEMSTFGESPSLTRGLSHPIPDLTYERPDVRKNVSGYFNDAPLDPIDLFIGSEGTLGVITEVELDLLPKPEGFFSGIVFFRDASDLMRFVDDAKTLSISNFKSQISDNFAASLIEYFDANALKFISEKFPETPGDASGAIFFEQETTAENEDELLEKWNDLLGTHNADLDRSWFTTNEQDREKMRAFRHALPVSVNERVVKNKQRKIGTDMAVPDENFASFLRYYKETLDASGLDYVIFGHIGDCHLHANMLPKDDAEAEKARHIYGRCVAQAIMLGGTVSAEHGIGKLKRKYLHAMMGERFLNEMADVKKAFDPKGILGRGNIFDESYL
ncbi:MAG: FAD-binding oxidoreductase [Pyrinomonadaceae bacterium]